MSAGISKKLVTEGDSKINVIISLGGGRGEPGMGNSMTNDATTTTMSTSTISSRASPQKGKRKNNTVDEDSSLTGMMKNIVTMCASNSAMCASNTIPSSTAVANTKDDLMLENLPLTELFKLIEQHKLHLKFMEDNGMSSEEGKLEIINEIKDIFLIIKNRSGTKRSRSVDLLEDNEGMSSEVGKKRGVSK